MDTSAAVLVTGANGHVGSNLVAALVDRGYSVRASVRDANDTSKTKALPRDKVELVSLDVRNAERFKEVSEGIDLLFHVAATYKNYVASQAEADDMVRDSLEGARSAILAAAANRIKKLVLTSSVVTVPLVTRGGPATTEDDWRTEFKVPYHRAKTLAERDAWKLAKEHGVNLVTVLPGAILGPGFERGTASTDTIESIMLGGMRMGAPDTNFPAVDIRDVVSGHILVAEKDTSGRYIFVNDVLPEFIDITRIMHAIDSSVPAAPRMLPDMALTFGAFFDWLNQRTLGAPRTLGSEFIAAVRGKVWTMSNARAKKELGWRQTITLEQSLADTMSTLRRLRGR